MRLNRALFSHPRFHRLVHALGGKRREAIAIVVELYVLAEEYYLPNRYPIPLLELEEWELPVGLLLSLGYIREVKPRQYEVRNARQEFAWWFKKRESIEKAAAASVESPNHHDKRDEKGRYASTDVPHGTTKFDEYVKSIEKREVPEKNPELPLDEPRGNFTEQSFRAGLPKSTPKKASRGGRNTRPPKKGQREEFFVWVGNEFTKAAKLTRHFSREAAEKAGAKRCPKWDGESPRTDYEVNVMTKKELVDLYVESDGEIHIDWDNDKIHFWDKKKKQGENSPPTLPQTKAKYGRPIQKLWDDLCDFASEHISEVSIDDIAALPAEQRAQLRRLATRAKKKALDKSKAPL